MTTNLSLKSQSPAPTPITSSGRIAFIEACWHKDIVDQARQSFLGTLVDHGIAADRVDVFEVPGSLEIPLQAKLVAKTGRYAVIVAAGFVVNGGIYRHDFVAASVIDGMMKVQLETDVPILSVVLTPLHFHEHGAHHDFFFEHFKVKGREAAEACVKTLENLDRVGALMTA
jgi:6,7-dimethyl-8-ribityllumazine synthase